MEDHFDQQGAGEKNAHEGGGKAGDHDQHGVAEDMPVEHPPFGQPLGPGREHELLVQLLQEAVLGEHGQGGEAADGQRRQGQRQVPQVVAHLGQGAQVIEVVRGQPTQGKPVEVGAAGEQDDQQDGEQEAGNGVGHEDDGAAPDVEGLPVAHRLGDAQRNGDGVDQQQRPKPEGNRHRQPLQHQVHHGAILEVAVAEIEAQIVPHHQQKAFVGWLVEAELLLEAGDQFRVQPGTARIATIARRPHGR